MGAGVTQGGDGGADPGHGRDRDAATASPLSSVAMSADGRYLALTTVRTKFVLPALQLLGEPRQVPGPRGALCGRSAGGDDRAGHPHLRRRRHHRRRPQRAHPLGRRLPGSPSPPSPPASSTATPTGDDRRLRRRAGAGRGAGATSPSPPPGAGLESRAIEEGHGGPVSGCRVKGLAGGAVRVTVSVPAAGGVKAVAKAAAGRPRKQRTLAAATARARGLTRSEVKLVLRPVERYRPELRRRRKIAGRAGGHLRRRPRRSPRGRGEPSSIAFRLKPRNGHRGEAGSEAPVTAR